MMIIRLNKSISLTDLSTHLQLDSQLLYESNDVELRGEIEANTQLNIPVNCLSIVENSDIVELVGDDKIKPEPMMKKPYDSNELEKEIEKLIFMYPFIKKDIVGYSVLGKPIYQLTIGNGPKKIHMNGSFHANEWITTSVMMYWLHEYVDALGNGSIRINGHDVQSIYKETTLSFVPMVNPDGVDLVLNGLPHDNTYEAGLLQMNDLSIDFSQWKANIRGIDLNNQYPVNWDIEKARKIPKTPAPRDYPGDAPLTEPEAIALSNLVKKQHFDRVLAFHTQGEEIYWGYLRKEPEEAEAIVREFERLSGYKAVRDIDSHAGFRDWFVHDYRKPGYTIELGNGVNPLPFDQFDDIYKKSKGIFYAALYM